jgi:capsule biosynthesis phosphatase
MRICIDLDGTICQIKRPDETYSDLKPLPGAKEKIHRLRAKGHYIIIQTARNMATYQGDLGKVMKNIGKITLDWLDKWQIEYDEIYFGKPNAELYLDDRALRFENWSLINEKNLQKASRSR